MANPIGEYMSNIDYDKLTLMMNVKMAKVKIGNEVVKVDPYYFRPTEVDCLLGDAKKAYEKLGWRPKISFRDLVSEMVVEDLKKMQRDLRPEALSERKEHFSETELRP